MITNPDFQGMSLFHKEYLRNATTEIVVMIKFIRHNDSTQCIKSTYKMRKMKKNNDNEQKIMIQWNTNRNYALLSSVNSNNFE